MKLLRTKVRNAPLRAALLEQAVARGEQQWTKN